MGVEPLIHIVATSTPLGILVSAAPGAAFPAWLALSWKAGILTRLLVVGRVLIQGVVQRIMALLHACPPVAAALASAIFQIIVVTLATLNLKGEAFGPALHPARSA